MQKEPVKKLIINADDVGLSPSINEAVRRCYSYGIITGVSVMACGKYFREAAAILREIENEEVGVHLTLTGSFSPCIEDTLCINDILDDRGVFVSDYRQLLLLSFRRRLDKDQVYQEFTAQVRRVKNEGLEIIHLDSHEHIHMFPGILDVVIKIAREFNIPYIRLPLEGKGIISKQFRVRDFFRHTGLRALAFKAEMIMDDTGIKHNDAFLGHFHSGRIDDDVLCFMMDNIGEGVSELTVHPGVMTGELLNESPWHSNAQVELNALMSEQWRRIMQSRNIRLVSHWEVIQQ